MICLFNTLIHLLISLSSVPRHPFLNKWLHCLPRSHAKNLRIIYNSSLFIILHIRSILEANDIIGVCSASNRAKNIVIGRTGIVKRRACIINVSVKKHSNERNGIRGILRAAEIDRRIKNVSCKFCSINIFKTHFQRHRPALQSSRVPLSNTVTISYPWLFKIRCK